MPLYQDLEKYQHVERLGSDECDGLLDGTVVIQEKIDGANASVAGTPDGIVIASRNQAISINGKPPTGFRGLVEYILAHAGICQFVRDHDLILRGEWLVPHSIVYDKDSYNKFYVFDVEDKQGNYIPYDDYKSMLESYGILMVPHIATLENPTPDDIVALVKDQPSALGNNNREGVVVKRYDYWNLYGRMTWGKVVSADFKEATALHMGYQRYQGNEPNEKEIKFAGMVTEQLVLKTIHKIKGDRGEVSIKDMKEILGRVYHDLVTEELWNFIKRKRVGSFNFHVARKMVERKTRDIALLYFNKLLNVYGHTKY